MNEVLEDQSDLERVQRGFAALVESLDHEAISTSIGFQGGSYPTEVWWVPSLEIWAHFGLPPSQKKNYDRYWNVFGIGRPGRLSRIICEVNSPFEGLNRRIGGAFAADRTGKLFILHRGIVRSHGLTRELFWQRYSGPRITAMDGGRSREFVFVLELDSESAPQNLRDFVFEVGRIKGRA